MSHMSIDTAVPLWLTLTVIIASAISLLGFIALFARFLSFAVYDCFEDHKITIPTIASVAILPLMIVAIAFTGISLYAEDTFDKNAEAINAHTGDSNTMVIDDTNGQSQIRIPANKDTTTACIAYNNTSWTTAVITNTLHTDLQCAPIDSNIVLLHKGH